jgi:hypothetical protein
MKRIVCALMVSLPLVASAQGGVLLQGVLDVEGWKTDTLSNVLRRNGGDPGALFRLRLWGAVEPTRGVFVFANVAAEGGNARRFDGPGTTVTLEQGGIRYAYHPTTVIDAGRMIHPVGAFGSRVISTRNPLIGIPDGYVPVYPIGVMLGGERGKVDYRLAVVSLPPTHREYVPDPDAAVRPVVAIGVTPIIGLRIAASATDGSYLNDELTANQLDGRDWASYAQRVLATEIQYGFGHFDFRSEFVVANFEVPRQGWIDGQAGYAGVRMTLTPRVFVAARGEFNRYPFIRPLTDSTWLARRTELRGFEGGVGFRFGANTLLKATFSADDWVVTPQNSSFVRPGGKAVAVQFSREFDLVELAARRR